MIEESIHQRVFLIARAGMHDHSGALVQHEEVVIFEKDLQWNGFGRGLYLLQRRNGHLNDIASSHQLACTRLLRV